jgi:aminoglycoside phosphotransferase (APT) family kinase protein
VPVPNVVAVVGDGPHDDELGADFCITEFVDGETIPQKILRGEGFAAALEGAVDQAATALARIHSIPVNAVAGLENTDQLGVYKDLYDALGQPHPTFELALRWLEANRSPAARTTVVHGDFRNGNFIFGSDGLHAVIDWELAHLGDPIEDIGWLCVKSWRFGHPAPVGGFGSYDELFETYERTSRTEIDRDAVRWWEVLGTLKWGVICIFQADKHLSGAERSLELAAIGRRVCEVEHDLLLLLAPSALASALEKVSAESPPPQRAARPPHDVPSSGDLLEAVGELLRSEILPITEGSVRFHTRVAANVVDIMQRELALGEGQAAAHARRLHSLGVADETAFAHAIRSGELDARRDQVLEAVAETVRDKLLVANPKYLVAPT